MVVQEITPTFPWDFYTVNFLLKNEVKTEIFELTKFTQSHNSHIHRIHTFTEFTYSQNSLINRIYNLTELRIHKIEQKSELLQPL